MTKDCLLVSIVADLGANYRDGDSEVLDMILEEVINDALFISNRLSLAENDLENQINILSSEIRRCAKSIYLQRGSEDTTSQSLAGISSQFVDAKEKLKNDIIRGGKRLIR